MALTSTLTFAEAMLCTTDDAPEIVSVAGLQRVTLYHMPPRAPTISVLTDTLRESSDSKASVSVDGVMLRTRP